MKDRTILNKKNKREGIAVLLAGVLFSIAGIMIPDDIVLEYITGYLLGFLPMLLHFIHIRLLRNLDNKKFMLTFYIGSFAKLLFVLSIYTLLLTVINFEQIHFTLSFIISYIFHSVIDIILIYKIYAKEIYQTF
ncbi:MAG: hypothetical protein WD599_00100 [Balneolaceae bacterium]